jgi:type IV pilus assembly protein PilW
MSFTTHRSLYNQTGMTLIEIMIALLIGAFLIGGVIQIFINSQQTYRMQNNLSRIQENGRFASNLIGRDVRKTSYWGCLTRASGDIAGGNSTITLKAAFATIPTGSCGTVVDKTAAYYTDATSTITYSINNTALRKSTNNQNNDLIEGVENMQILYGEDTNTDNWANYYTTANNVVNWENVVSIRVSLLIISLDDNLAAQPLAYTFNGVTTTPTDRRLRRVFTSTFAIRNRLP